MDKESDIRTGIKNTITGVAGSGAVMADKFFTALPEDAASLLADASTGKPLGWTIVFESVTSDKDSSAGLVQTYIHRLYHIRQFEAAVSYDAMITHVKAVYDALKTNRTLGVAGAQHNFLQVEKADDVFQAEDMRLVHVVNTFLVTEWDQSCI
jgi:hypothetical protein